MVEIIKEKVNALKSNKPVIYKVIAIIFNIIAILGVFYLIHLDATEKSPYRLFIELVN